MQHVNSKSISQNASSGRAAAIENILLAVGDEAARSGLDRIRMGEIAARANVSRASLYRYFASKDELIRAWTTRELETIFAEADRAAAEAETSGERLAAGFASMLIALRNHPIFRAVVASNNTQIVRSTLESGEAINRSRELLLRIDDSTSADRLSVGQDDSSVAGELIARLAMSLTVAPESIGRLDSEADVREFALKHIAPLASGSRDDRPLG
ncbi:MAG: TetR/AcrR family transcriptional regulator [Thermoleophilaceae bacterium]|nr:TetR/AcrR family transcriptional regulator [Thermoleophilaceae bacterium]